MRMKEFLAILGSDQDLATEDLTTSTHDGGGGSDPGTDTTPLNLVGTSGNNSLVGGAGNDTISGLAGNDTLIGNDGDDSIDGGASADTIDGGNGNDTLIGGDGNDLIDGRAGNDSIDGGNGDDTLYGGAGVDTILGGSGNDAYYVDDPNDVVIDVPNEEPAPSTLANAVAPAALQGITDTVFAAVSYSLANVAYVENLTLEAGTSGTTATGNELANVLTGNALNNTLSALDGNDTLIGGGGNDTLDGGGGTDTATFSGSRAASTIGAGGANVTGTEGSDVLSGIERLQFSDRGVAFDLSAGEAAGNTVRIIGAAFDASAIQERPDWVAEGLDLFDSGMSMQAVCELVVSLMGLSNTDFVTTVYTNVVGAAPSAADRDYFVAWLQGSGGSMTQAELLEFAAHHSLNETNIDLVGMQETGVEFT